MIATLTALLLQSASGIAAPDYADDANWLCLPGRDDACTSVDLTATVVEADGSTTTEPFEAADDPAVDCFYVYPTVSTDETPNSDMSIDEAETRVVQAQAARFAEACRVYAPMYRQVTLSALRAMMAGQPVEIDREKAYGDVQRAFTHYLENDNDGRPFVLLGHSQGSGMIVEVAKRVVDGQPVQDRMLSIMPIGTNVTVPEDAAVGGAFQSIPVCESADQTGCVVSYVTFNSDAPPPENSRFGRAEDGMSVACVDPASLLGKDDLEAYLAAGPVGESGRPPAAWTADGEVPTDWVKVPGLLTAECRQEDGAHYLAVSVEADKDDPRTDDIGGEVVAGNQVLRDWGLHLLDVNVAQGDLIELVRRQGAAYEAAQSGD